MYKPHNSYRTVSIVTFAAFPFIMGFPHAYGAGKAVTYCTLTGGSMKEQLQNLPKDDIIKVQPITASVNCEEKKR